MKNIRLTSVVRPSSTFALRTAPAPAPAAVQWASELAGCAVLLLVMALAWIA